MTLDFSNEPRNPWTRLQYALRLARVGQIDEAIRLLESVKYHPSVDKSDLSRVACQISRMKNICENTLKINGPADFWENREAQWLLPFRVMKTEQEAPMPYPVDLALPDLIGVENDFWYLHQAAASVKAEPHSRLLISYVSEDVEAFSRFLDSLNAQQKGVSVRLLVFFEGDDGPYLSLLKGQAFECNLHRVPFLSEHGQSILTKEAQEFDLVAVLSGEVILDSGALIRAAHLNQISDLVVQPLFNISDEISCNTPYAVRSAPKILKSRFPFREVKSLNIFIPGPLFSKISGFETQFSNLVLAAREFSFRAFNAGGYFSPLLVTFVGDGALNASDEDSDIYNNLCPNRWDRKGDGQYLVPKVSIYIPVYNAGQYITQAVDSVLSQDFLDLEVCMVNDGSTDNTLEILERNFGSDRRVRWLDLPNGGIGHASNEAISMSRGIYVGQLDSDDRLKPGAVKRMADYLDEHSNVACCYGSCERVDAEGRYLQDEYSWKTFSRQKMMITSIAHHFRMFRRANWERTSKFRTDIRNAVDYDIFLKLAETGSFHHIDEVLYQRRWHGQNTSSVNESFQTANTYRVQREALRRQGLNKYWDVHVADAHLPRRVGYKRSVQTPMVMFWPNYSRANPYQKLLYKSAQLTHEVVAAPIEEVLRVQENAPAGMSHIFHLHWTNFLFVGAEAKVDVRLRIRSFLKSLTKFRDLGGKICWTIHNTLSHDNVFADLERGLSKRIVELADVIHFHSQASVAEVREVFEIPDYKIRISRHGHYIGTYADYVDSETARKTLGIDEHEDVILFCGQVRPYKGVGHLVQSFRALLSDYPNARLIIAGAVHEDFWSTVSPNLTEAEQARIVTTDRFLDETEMQVFFRAADVAVFPYRNVLTSGSLLLSLSFGVPAVVPRVGMTAELLDGTRAGFLYDREDKQGLENALRTALAAKESGCLRAMQKAALDCAEAQTWPSVDKTLFSDL